MEESNKLANLGGNINKPQIIIMPNENSESEKSGSYEFSLQKQADWKDLIMIKYKSVKNARNRLGSEDIALRSIPNTKNETKTPNNGSSNTFFPKNAWESNASNSVPMFGVGSFEKYENIHHNASKIETKSGSQVIKADSPSKKITSVLNSNSLTQLKNLQPVKEEEKNENSQNGSFNEFNRDSYHFGKDYRQSFK